MNDSPALALARELMRRPSVTPDDAGCLPLIGARLAAAGFRLEYLRIGNVDNLWAIAGEAGPLVCLAGHTDVVPPGPLTTWRQDPFAAIVDDDGWLNGRGAADMKASVAAMVCAAERFRGAHPDHPGRLAFLLTSDEEGPGVDGTKAVMRWLAERETQIDYCLVGEPSSEARLGDTIKNGRRGSLNGRLTVMGVQGHVAYPQNADNALHRMLPLLAELTRQRWDDGDADFPPTSFQITQVATGANAENMIPGSAEAVFNWRFNPQQNEQTIRQQVDLLCARHDVDPAAIEWKVSGEPFITRDGALLEAALRAVREHTGQTPRLSTAGGTSDGRFIAPTGAEVIELGPCNDTIHKANERIRADDVERLALIYEALVGNLLLAH